MGVNELWSNPNDTLTFSAQDISIANLSDYKLIVIGYRTKNDNSTYTGIIIPNVLNWVTYLTSAISGTRRTATIGNNKISISAETIASDNTYLIPSKIYGIK